MEPIFTLIFSYFILEESLELKIQLILIPISFGVALIAYGELYFNPFGFTCAFAANIASAARSIFYKNTVNSTIEGSSLYELSQFKMFINIGFFSFILFLPIFTLHTLFRFSFYDKISIFSTPLFIYDNSSLCYLILASMFNFLYNLLSLKVLSKIDTISHSIANIMKRVFIIFCSIFAFHTQITNIQWLGMIFSDIGIFLYSILKIKSNIIKVKIPKSRKAFIKILITYFVAFILIMCSYIESTSRNQHKNTKIVPKINNKILNIYRLRCIEQIKGWLLFKLFFDYYFFFIIIYLI